MGKVVKAVGKAVGSVFKAVGNFVGMLFKTPKVPKTTANASTETRLNATLVPEERKKIAFGETALGADMRFWETYGSTNSNHVQVIASTGHEIESFGNLYLDEVPVPFDGSGYATAAYAGQLMRRTVKKGVSGSGFTLGSGTRWTPSASMTGCSYYVLDWIYDQAKMPNGIPSRVTQVGKGAKLFDPRRWTIYGGTHDPANPATWEYAPLDSNGQPIGRNNALQMLAYQLGIKVQNAQTGAWILIGGRGVDIADIDFDSFITAANNCEVEGWYSDCLLSTADDHSTNEGILEAASGGELIDVGGRMSYFVSTDDTADVTLYLDESDIVGDIDWEPRLPIAQQFNEVPGSFVDPAALFQTRPLPLCFDQNYYDQDGYKKRGEELKLSAVQNPAQGQKLQRLRLNRSRFQGVFTAPFNLKALRVRPWSLIRLSFEPFAWTNKLFRVRQQGIGTTGGIQLVLEEEDASIYTPGTVVTLPPPSAGYGGDPGLKPVVGSLTAIASGIYSGGSARDTIEVGWALASQFVKHTEIRYRKTGDSSWQTEGPVKRDRNVVVIGPLLPTTSYEVQVRHVSLWDVEGDWASVTRSTNAVTVNPAGQITYADGTPVENLKPGEAGANVTGTHTAASIFGQGPGATASADQVMNNRLPVGQNAAPNSEFFTAGGSNYPIGYAGAWNGNTGFVPYRDVRIGKRRAVVAGIDPSVGVPANGTVFDMIVMNNNDVRRYALPVKSGETVGGSWLLAMQNVADVQPYWAFYDQTGAFVSGTTETIGGFTAISNGDSADPANYGLRTHIAVVPNNPAIAYAFSIVRVTCNGSAYPYAWAMSPMMTRLNDGALVVPPYSPTPIDRASDRTGENIASGFVGQGSLATQSQADWASQITGTGKPANNATASFVYRQQFEPSGASVNDIWIVTNSSGSPLSVRAFNGSFWVTGADLTSLNTAAAIFGQGWGATASEIAAANYLSPLGTNQVIDSDLTRGAATYRTNWFSNISAYTGFVYTGGQSPVAVAFLNSATTTSGVFDIYTQGPSLTPFKNTLQQYGMAVTPGDRVFASALACFTNGATSVGATIGFYDGSGNYIFEVGVGSGGRANTDSGGNLALMDRIGGFYNIPTSGPVNGRDWSEVRWAIVWYRAYKGTANGDANSQIAQPMLCKVPAQQTAWPVYQVGPSEKRSDQTSLNIAAGFSGQGPLATSPRTETEVVNINVPVGQNVAPNSGFEGGGIIPIGYVAGWDGDGGSPIYRDIRGGKGRSVVAGTNVALFNGAVFDLLGPNPNIKRYALPVKPGDRVGGSWDVAFQNTNQPDAYIAYYSETGSFITAGTLIQGGYAANANGDTVDPANYHTLTVIDVVPNNTSIAYAFCIVRAHCNGSAYPYIWGMNPVLCKLAPNQANVPAYVPTTLDRASDKTGENTAAAIVGQSGFATLNRPTSVVGKLKDNGRGTGTYQVSNGVLTGATLYRSPVYVLGSQDLGSSARITIAASTLRGSGIVVSYSAGTIDGAAYQTTYYVWIYDPDVLGGTVTYIATTDPNAYIENPDYLFVGNVRTLAAGGGTPTPAPPPPMPPGYYDCVAVEAWLPTDQQAFEIKTGDRLLMLNEAGDNTEIGVCTANKIALAPCMRFETVSGISLTCSTTTPILFKTEDGYGVKPAWECDGSESVPVVDHKGFRWESLVCQPGHVGQKQVAHISANDGVYAAGDTKYGFMLTHNIRMDDYVKP